MQRIIFILFISALVSCGEHKLKQIPSLVLYDTAHSSRDSMPYFFDYSYTLAFSEVEQKNRSQTFTECYSSNEGREAYDTLRMHIAKKYKFKSVSYCGKYEPAEELFLLREPDSVRYVCDGKEYKKVHPRHDSVRNEIINELHKLSPLFDVVNFRFYDSSGNLYELGTSFDTLYKDYNPNATLRKKIAGLKGKLEGVCNWLKGFYNTYDKVHAKTYIFKQGSKTCTYVEFNIPLDSARKESSNGSLLLPVIPGLKKRVGAISSDFHCIRLSCSGYMGRNHIDTFFSIREEKRLSMNGSQWKSDSLTKICTIKTWWKRAENMLDLYNVSSALGDSNTITFINSTTIPASKNTATYRRKFMDSLALKITDSVYTIYNKEKTDCFIPNNQRFYIRAFFSNEGEKGRSQFVKKLYNPKTLGFPATSKK